MPRSPLWPAGDDILREEWSKGTPCPQIALILADRLNHPVTGSAVKQRAARIDLPRRTMGWQYGRPGQQAVPVPVVKRPDEEMIYVPQWCLRVWSHLCAVTNGNVFEGVLKIGTTDSGQIGRAIKQLTTLGAIDSERLIWKTGRRGGSARRITLLVPADAVADSLGVDTSLRKAKAADRFEQAWRRAFPQGADYRVGKYPEKAVIAAEEAAA